MPSEEESSEKSSVIEKLSSADAATSKVNTKKLKTLEGLKNRRLVTMNQINRVRDFAIKANDDPSSLSLPELQVRMEALESAFHVFEEVQSKIEDNDFEEISKPERSKYEEMYYVTVATLKVLINQNQQERDKPMDVSHISNYQRLDSIKLPKIELPSFSGDVTKWMGWYNQFVSLVHDNPALSKQSKFHYLVSKLSETAIAPIEGLKIEDDNYDVALARLKERFKNRKVIAQEHLQRIFNHPKAQKASAVELRSLLDKITNHLTGLRNLKRPVDHWDDLIVFIITTKLDASTLSKWHDEAPVDRLPSLLELTNFLKKRAQHLEGNVPNHLFNYDTSPKSDISRNHKSNHKGSPKSFIATKITCNFCSSPGHLIYRCHKFQNLSVPERIQQIKNLNLCFNCLKTTEHSGANCPSSSCRQCGNKHHTLLHLGQNMTAQVPQTPLSNHSSNRNQAINPHTGSYQSHATTSATINPAPNYSMHASCAENNILGTAVVNVFNKLKQPVPCRVLLDSGSQIHMISERLMQRLGLPRRLSRTSLTCVNNTETLAKHKVTLTIGSRINGFTSTLEAFVMHQITGPLPDNKIDIHYWHIPKNIRLSDPLFNVLQRIDILLGVDLFYNLLCVGQIKLGPNLPILQNTMLGWVVAGKIPTANISNHFSLFTQESSLLPSDELLDNSIKAFWQIENFDALQSTLTKEEKECEAHFSAHYSRLESGRYNVRLPFKQSPSLLGNSFDIALKRLTYLP